MNKITKSQKGFTAVEGLLILLILVLVGAVGYFVYHNDHQSKTLNATTADKTTSSKSNISNSNKTVSAANAYAGWNTYTSSDNTYTVRYPANWVTDPCSKTNACSTTGEVDTFLSPASNSSWQVVRLSHNKSTLSAEDWFNQEENSPSPDDCLYATSTSAVSGYDTYSTEMYQPLNISNPSCPSSPPAGAYTYGLEGNVGYSDYYVFAHNGQVVELSMPVQDGSNGTRNTVPLVSTFKQIAYSIKFNN